MMIVLNKMNGNSSINDSSYIDDTESNNDIATSIEFKTDIIGERVDNFTKRYFWKYFHNTSVNINSTSPIHRRRIPTNIDNIYCLKLLTDVL